MAVKRSFNIKNKKYRTCLNCNSQIEEKELQDNTFYTCSQCGQKQSVDIYGTQCVLTVSERPEFRRRRELLSSEEREIMSELKDAKEIASKWKDAAEGLAQMVEELKEKEKRRGKVKVQVTRKKL